MEAKKLFLCKLDVTISLMYLHIYDILILACFMVFQDRKCDLIFNPKDKGLFMVQIKI